MQRLRYRAELGRRDEQVAFDRESLKKYGAALSRGMTVPSKDRRNRQSKHDISRERARISLEAGASGITEHHQRSTRDAEAPYHDVKDFKDTGEKRLDNRASSARRWCGCDEPADVPTRTACADGVDDRQRHRPAAPKLGPGSSSKAAMSGRR